MTQFTQEKHGGLVSKDGSFLCAPDYAVEVAYMVSNMESIYDQDRVYRSAVLEVFEQYLRGDIDTHEVNAILFEEWPKCFPGLNQKEENDKSE